MSTEPGNGKAEIQAVGLTTFGPPDVLGVVRLRMPVTGPGEVVVRVVAATVNPTDTLLRAGMQAAGMTELVPPYVPGMELAGFVHQVGVGVTGLAPGEPVIGLVDPRRPDGGAQAEYVRLPAASVAALKDSDNLVEAATVPMNGLTALMALEELGLSPGDTVLVTGGAGAVGGYVIELAKAAGLHVIADGKQSDTHLLIRLGVDELVPRGQAMPESVRARYPEGVAGLVDAARIGVDAIDLVREGGCAVGVRKSDEVADERVRRRYVSVSSRASDTAALQKLAELFAAGTITPRVSAVLPFAEASEAHRLVEKGGLRGRVVLTFQTA